jgi:hypothetical protein
MDFVPTSLRSNAFNGDRNARDIGSALQHGPAGYLEKCMA